jgi:hypothetical protein
MLRDRTSLHYRILWCCRFEYDGDLRCKSCLFLDSLELKRFENGVWRTLEKLENEAQRIKIIEDSFEVKLGAGERRAIAHSGVAVHQMLEGKHKAAL